MVARAMVALCMLVAGSGLAAMGAEEKPISRLDLDKRIAKIANESISLGYALYEEKNYEGCSRLYEGTLLALEPLLDHHPKLAEMVGESLKKSREPDITSAQAAVELRKALDAVQKETAKALMPKTAWDRIGGEEGARAIAKDFLLAIAADPKVNITRGGTIKFDAEKYETLQKHLVGWISQQLGGPLKYTGPDIRKAFAGLGVTEAEFGAATADFAAILKDYQVPEEESKKLITNAEREKTQIVRP